MLIPFIIFMIMNIFKYMFIQLQETHSVEGRARMLRLPSHSTAFYSHGTARTAGVCLWVKKAFLQQFNPITDR